MWQHMWLPCLHTSACSVGLSLGVEVLPATCSPCTPPASLGRNSSSCHTKEMLKLPLQLTEGGRRFSRGAKMQLQLSRIGFGEEHEPFLSVHTRPLDQSSVSCTSLSSGVLSCLSTIAILLSSDHLLPLFLADHYMQVLACKHDCVRELATRSGRISPIENFLPLHYDYLQFAYYRGKGSCTVPRSTC